MKLIKGLRALTKAAFGTAEDRYEARYELLSVVADRMSFRLYNRNLRWLRDEEFLNVWRGFPESGNRIHERRFNLYYLARSVRELPGDTAECGVFRGGGSYLIARATEAEGRTHHIFDSFEGLSRPSREDAVAFAHTFKWKENDLATDQSIVEKNLSGLNNVRLYKGWIPDRFPDVADRRFCLVHIDVDLYQPTLDSLAFFYDHMTVGGIIVCDDYGSDGCPGAYQAMNEFFADKPETVVHLTTGQGIVVKHPPSPRTKQPHTVADTVAG